MLKLMGSYFKTSNILGRDRVMVRVDGDAYGGTFCLGIKRVGWLKEEFIG